MSKILIADDEPYIRMLLEQTLEDLEDHGIEIFSAEDGQDAMDIIHQERPNLVFLDVMMPRLSGFDVCSLVKKDSSLKDHVFIIMLTAKGQAMDKQKGLEVGADIYMTKPFNPDEVAMKAYEVLGIQFDG